VRIGETAKGAAMPINAAGVDKNEVHLAGRIVRDPVIKYTATEKCVASLTVVTKYEKYSEFHRIVAWEKLAEKAADLKKGDFVRIVGRLQTRSWDDKQTGQKKYATEVVAFQISIPADEPAPITPDPSRQEPAKPAQSGTAQAKAILRPAEKNIHGVEITDDDIGF
jgi:single-strand DNA-binding protein